MWLALRPAQRRIPMGEIRATSGSGGSHLDVHVVQVGVRVVGSVRRDGGAKNLVPDTVHRVAATGRTWCSTRSYATPNSKACVGIARHQTVRCARRHGLRQPSAPESSRPLRSKRESLAALYRRVGAARTAPSRPNAEPHTTGALQRPLTSVNVHEHPWRNGRDSQIGVFWVA